MFYRNDIEIIISPFNISLSHQAGRDFETFFRPLQMIFVFCIYTNHLLSFKVKEDDTVHDLQLRLQAETKIAVAEQELLLNTGLSPDPSKPAKMYAADLVTTRQFYL